MLLFIFAVQLSACFWMLGLSFFLKVVYYPYFTYIRKEVFREVERKHVHYTSYVTFPVMVIELVSAFVITWGFWKTAYMGWTSVNLLILLVIWFLTFRYVTQDHVRLLHGFDGASHRRLMSIHAVRCYLWLIRGLLLLGMAVHLC